MDQLLWKKAERSANLRQAREKSRDTRIPNIQLSEPGPTVGTHIRRLTLAQGGNVRKSRYSLVERDDGWNDDGFGCGRTPGPAGLPS